MIINTQNCIDQYLVPIVDELRATLQYGQKFTKLGISDAYRQLELVNEGKQRVMINTLYGLFRYNEIRRPYPSARSIRSSEEFLSVPHT